MFFQVSIDGSEVRISFYVAEFFCFFDAVEAVMVFVVVTGGMGGNPSFGVIGCVGGVYNDFFVTAIAPPTEAFEFGFHEVQAMP